MRISDWSSDVCSSDLRNPSVSLEEFLGGMGDYLKGIQYKYADNPITIEAQLDCNWKVACDAFSEAYHIPAIHATTIGKTFSSQDNKFAHILGDRKSVVEGKSVPVRVALGGHRHINKRKKTHTTK